MNKSRQDNTQMTLTAANKYDKTDSRQKQNELQTNQ